MVRKLGFECFTVAKNLNAQAAWLHPRAGGPTREDVIDERRALPAGVGPALGDAQQRGGGGKGGAEGLRLVQHAVEVAHDEEGGVFGLPAGNPGGKGGDLAGQQHALRAGGVVQAFRLAAGFQMYHQDAQQMAARQHKRCVQAVAQGEGCFGFHVQRRVIFLANDGDVVADGQPHALDDGLARGDEGVAGGVEDQGCGCRAVHFLKGHDIGCEFGGVACKFGKVFGFSDVDVGREMGFGVASRGEPVEVPGADFEWCRLGVGDDKRECSDEWSKKGFHHEGTKTTKGFTKKRRFVFVTPSCPSCRRG